MRKFIITLLVAMASVGYARAGEEPGAKVIAYYFHGSFRCPTCTAMEKYSKEAVDANFKDELASGKLEFKPVNVETRGNEHFVEDYRLFTKSIILSLVKDGKEVRHKNLEMIWRLARDRQKFTKYVAGEIKEFMKEAQ